jgi:hypothetical protein
MFWLNFLPPNANAGDTVERNLNAINIPMPKALRLLGKSGITRANVSQLARRAAQFLRANETARNFLRAE